MDKTAAKAASDELDTARLYAMAEMLPKETKELEVQRQFYGYLNYSTWNEFIREMIDQAYMDHDNYTKFAQRQGELLSLQHVNWTTLKSS